MLLLSSTSTSSQGSSDFPDLPLDFFDFLDLDFFDFFDFDFLDFLFERVFVLLPMSSVVMGMSVV